MNRAEYSVLRPWCQACWRRGGKWRLRCYVFFLLFLIKLYQGMHSTEFLVDGYCFGRNTGSDTCVSLVEHGVYRTMEGWDEKDCEKAFGRCLFSWRRLAVKAGARGPTLYIVRSEERPPLVLNVYEPRDDEQYNFELLTSSVHFWKSGAYLVLG